MTSRTAIADPYLRSPSKTSPPSAKPACRATRRAAISTSTTPTWHATGGVGTPTSTRPTTSSSSDQKHLRRPLARPRHRSRRLLPPHWPTLVILLFKPSRKSILASHCPRIVSLPPAFVIFQSSRSNWKRFHLRPFTTWNWMMENTLANLRVAITCPSITRICGDTNASTTTLRTEIERCKHFDWLKNCKNGTH